MAAYTFRMPSGIPGSIDRAEHSTIEQQIVLSTAPPTSYGVPVVIDSATSKIRPVTTGDTAPQVRGFNVRPYPTVGAPLQNDPLGTTTPPTAGITNIMRRGYLHVLLGGATAAVKGGPVYVRVAAAAAGKPIGGIEAAADSTNTILLDGTGNSLRCLFLGPADAQGNTVIEIAI